jgi:hypothetical protein
MKSYIINQTANNLITAFTTLQKLSDIEFEYRVYYNPDTTECLFNTIEKPEGTFIIITREEYDSIDICHNYYVIKNKLKKKLVDQSGTKLLQLSESGYRTIKGNNIFIVDDKYTGETEYWNIKDD